MEKVTKADLMWIGYQQDGELWISPYTGKVMSLSEALQIEQDRVKAQLEKLDE